MAYEFANYKRERRARCDAYCLSEFPYPFVRLDLSLKLITKYHLCASFSIFPGPSEDCMHMPWTLCYWSSPVYLRSVHRGPYALGNAIAFTGYKKSKMLPVSTNCYLKIYLSPLPEWSVHSLTKLPFSHAHTFVHSILTLNAFLSTLPPPSSQ